MKKYNFSAYKRESIYMLEHLLQLIEERNDCDTDQSKRDAEIKYLKRLIAIRRFWRPRDWMNLLYIKFTNMYVKISARFDQYKTRRIDHMTPDDRTNYYRKRISSLEKKIISIYADYDDLTCDCSFVQAHTLITSDKLREKLKPLLWERRIILDQMFRATPKEVARLTEINSKLQQHVENLKQQLTNLYKADVEYARGKDLDEMYEGFLFAYPLLIESFDGEEFYGSDFEKMLLIEYTLLSDDSMESCTNLRIYPFENMSCDPQHLKIDLDYIEGADYTETWRKLDELSDIKFCHALHHMLDHQNLPMVDVLHKTSFCITLKHEINT